MTIGDQPAFPESIQGLRDYISGLSDSELAALAIKCKHSEDDYSEDMIYAEQMKRSDAKKKGCK